MSAYTSNKPLRLSSFTAADLWHRRLGRTQAGPSSNNKVQPRLCAELILRPILRPRDAQPFSASPSVDADCDAA